MYSQTCVQRPPLGPEKCGCYAEAGRYGLNLAVVHRWPLFGGGR
jgi:hypothetical protein